MAPVRVHVTWRTKGGVKPPGVVYCGRPSRWGNPYRVGEYAQRPGSLIHHEVKDAATAVNLFREYAVDRLRREPGWLDPLRGATGLACWCKSGPCHVDILISLIQSSETHEI